MGVYLRLTPATTAVLEFLLALDEPTWGLQIVRGTGRPAGTVYPLLERLESERFVVSAWDDDEGRPGPRRRLYELTPAGTSWARERLAKKSNEKRQ